MARIWPTFGILWANGGDRAWKPASEAFQPSGVDQSIRPQIVEKPLDRAAAERRELGYQIFHCTAGRSLRPDGVQQLRFVPRASIDFVLGVWRSRLIDFAQLTR